MGGTLLAPRWHTFVMVAWLVAVPTLALLFGAPTAPQAFEQACVSLVAIEWGWVLAVWAGLRLHRTHLIAVIGRPRISDLAWGIGACAGLLFIEAMWPTGAPGRFAPAGLAEHALWAVVALSAAFAEEFVFRGYLQRQLAALAGSVGVGIFVQAVLFGLIHGDQGWIVAVRIGLYGLGFGLLARLRGTLWAGLVGHFAVNLLSGWLR